jgi:hypothetical protein
LGTLLGYKWLHKKLLMENLVILDIDWFYRRFGTLFLRFCSEVLDRIGRVAQETLSRLVAEVRRMSRDPFYDAENLFMKMKVNLELRLGSGSSKGHPSAGTLVPDPRLKRSRGFNENFYRRPVGWYVLVVVFLFFFLAWMLMAGQQG